MLLLFQVCFFVGVGLTIISFVLGNLLDFGGFDGFDADFDFSGSFLPISPSLIVIFITIFGGSGMIMLKSIHISKILIVLLSVGISFFISLLIQKFIISPLKKAQNTSSPELEELIGIPATVKENILEDAFGEITYVTHGNSFSAPAKSVDRTSISAGTEVSICWIDEHVFFVTPLNIASKTKEGVL